MVAANTIKRWLVATESTSSRTWSIGRTPKIAAFWADRLMLTPLGGFLKGSGNWEWVYTRGRQPSHLMSWTHSATLGRDHYVKIVTRGYLFPTGHPAARVKISERKIAMTADGPVAYLRQRVYVQVRQATMTYTEAQQRELGFTSITLLTRETPPLSPDSKAPGGPEKVFWTLVKSGAFPFSVQAVDTDGKTVKLVHAADLRGSREGTGRVVHRQLAHPVLRSKGRHERPEATAAALPIRPRRSRSLRRATTRSRPPTPSMRSTSPQCPQRRPINSIRRNIGAC